MTIGEALARGVRFYDMDGMRLHTECDIMKEVCSGRSVLNDETWRRMCAKMRGAERARERRALIG